MFKRLPRLILSSVLVRTLNVLSDELDLKIVGRMIFQVQRHALGAKWATYTHSIDHSRDGLNGTNRRGRGLHGILERFVNLFGKAHDLVAVPELLEEL